MKVKNSWWKWCSYPRHSALWCKLQHCPSDLGAANCSDTHGKLPAAAAQTLAAGSETEREREMSHLQIVWMMLRCTGLLEDTVCYLQACALVWERWAEKGGDDAHDGLSNVALQNCVSVLTVTRVITHLQEAMLNVWTSRPYCKYICEFVWSYSADVHQEIIKKFPHVIAGVNLLHLHLCIHIAVIQEVHIGHLHLHMKYYIHITYNDFLTKSKSKSILHIHQRHVWALFPWHTHLRYAVLVSDHTYNIIEGEQGVAFDLSVDILPFSAHSQQFH